MREWVIPLKTGLPSHVLLGTCWIIQCCLQRSAFRAWEAHVVSSVMKLQVMHCCLRSPVKATYETWMKCFRNPPYLFLCPQSSIRHSRVWRSVLTATCINTLMHQADTSGDVVYYPSLALTCWEPWIPEFLLSPSQKKDKWHFCPGTPLLIVT